MNGVFNILKPPAMTSSDVVVHLRRILGMKKIGHTGTLDPGAAGVLPVCVGKATKLADYIMNGEKEYIAEVTFGVLTDTLDTYGTKTDESPCHITREAILAVLPDFLGEQMQQTPMFSAVKIGGKKLYELARKGVVIEKPPRSVFVKEIELLGGETNKFLLRIACGKGTYIRTLLADIAAALGTFGTTSFLLRTKTAGFEIDKTVTLAEMEQLAAEGRAQSVMISMEEACAVFERLELKEYLYGFVSNGVAIDIEKAEIAPKDDRLYSVFCCDELIGIGKKQDDFLKIVTMLKV